MTHDELDFSKTKAIGWYCATGGEIYHWAIDEGSVLTECAECAECEDYLTERDANEKKRPN